MNPHVAQLYVQPETQVCKKKKKKFFFNVLHAQMLIVEYWFIVHLQACGFLNFPSVYFPCIFIK